MDRLRRLLVAVAGVLIPACAMAQQSGRVHRVAYALSTPVAAERARGPFPHFEAFRERLAERGYVHGRNLELKVFYRPAETGEEGPWREEVMRDILAWKPNLVMVNTTAFAKVAQKATSTIPIVFAVVQDPQRHGIVTNPTRPEANVTGAAIHYESLAAKRLELARELLPSARRALIAIDRTAGGISPSARHELQEASKRLSFAYLELDTAEIPGGLCKAGRRAAEMRAEVILPFGNILAPPSFKRAWADGYGECLAAMQREAGVPILDDSTNTPGQGVALALGEKIVTSFHRAADFAARILSGTQPRDLPVDFQMRVELVMNLRSMRELGVTPPPSIRLRADRIIE